MNIKVINPKDIKEGAKGTENKASISLLLSDKVNLKGKKKVQNALSIKGKIDN